MSMGLAKRPSGYLRRLKEGDRITWRMPFVGSVWDGTVAHVNGASFTIRWDRGELGTFAYNNRLIWNVERIG
jgi:hypothetical protein